MRSTSPILRATLSNSASERECMKRFQEIYLKAKATILPWLSYMSHIRSTSVLNPSPSTLGARPQALLPRVLAGAAAQDPGGRRGWAGWRRSQIGTGRRRGGAGVGRGPRRGGAGAHRRGARDGSHGGGE
jgi:hypothetical protein